MGKRAVKCWRCHQLERRWCQVGLGSKLPIGVKAPVRWECTFTPKNATFGLTLPTVLVVLGHFHPIYSPTVIKKR